MVDNLEIVRSLIIASNELEAWLVKAPDMIAPAEAKRQRRLIQDWRKLAEQIEK